MVKQGSSNGDVIKWMKVQSQIMDAQGKGIM
jgi:hypothetical protein